tara:strand:+ start:216 stop:479 length:264 start_codon:yes stop_codon:yes gene_type:complete
MRGKTISDADRARANRMTMNESGRTISDADRARATRMVRERQAEKMITEMLNEGGRNISDADRARVSELTKSLNKNDGGMAKKTRVF